MRFYFSFQVLSLPFIIVFWLLVGWDLVILVSRLCIYFPVGWDLVIVCPMICIRLHDARVWQCWSDARALYSVWLWYRCGGARAVRLLVPAHSYIARMRGLWFTFLFTRSSTLCLFVSSDDPIRPDPGMVGAWGVPWKSFPCPIFGITTTGDWSNVIRTSALIWSVALAFWLCVDCLALVAWLYL